MEWIKYLGALLVILLLVVGMGCTQPDSTPDSSNVDQPQEGDDESVVDGVNIDEELAEIVDEFELPALAALVFDGEEVVAKGAVGLRSVASDEEVSDEDPFHIGSCTKPMTATLVGRLSENGDVSMEATLEELFPTLAGEGMHEDYRSVTMADLLRHEAGLPESLAASWPELWDEMWERGNQDVAGMRQEVASQLLDEAPANEVGKFHYSNAGYIIAGAAMEQATDSTWEDLMEEEVFSPLGMERCGFGAPATPGEVDAPWGHQGAAGQLTAVSPGPQADNPPSLGPAGTVHCSLRDWMRFAAVHVGEGPQGYLDESTLEELHRPGDGDYVAGWNKLHRDWGHGAVLNHAGSNTMFYATAWLAPSRDMGILMATNSAHEAAPAGLDRVAEVMIDKFF